jgi:hypothetical protein
MLDFRAWIIAGVILLTAAGAYVIWITRPRAVITGRSLSASPNPSNTPAKPVKTSLHVEGCREDFITQPGELVEPRVIPGASIEQFRTIYGPESSSESAGITQWEQNAFTLTGSGEGAEPQKAFVHLALHQGHVVETLDGVELGIDSFGTIFRKMRDKKVEVHERLDHSDGNWTLTVSLYSACGRKFRSEYTRTLPADPETDRLITKLSPPGPTGQPAPWRSDTFMNKVVTEYSMIPSNGHDDSTRGSPSEHN